MGRNCCTSATGVDWSPALPASPGRGRAMGGSGGSCSVLLDCYKASVLCIQCDHFGDTLEAERGHLLSDKFRSLRVRDAERQLPNWQLSSFTCLNRLRFDFF